MGMRIRSYSESDEAAVAELWREVFPGSPSWNHPETDIRRKLAIQRELFLVATIDLELAGTAMAGYDGHRGWVYYVAVRPKHRRQGIGKKLIEIVLAQARKNGIQRSMVYSANKDYISTASFYENCGFKMWHIFMTQ